MNYRGKKIAITGVDGFLGNHLSSYLFSLAEIVKVSGDTRDIKTFEVLDYTFDYLFHFAAPSSQILFKQQPMYAADVTINGFINAAKVCRENGIKLIYPSTGLLSQSKANEYARCKAICEDIHKGENLDAIGLRIFATYGPGEGHKRDYASVPYIFARDVAAGRKPIVFGDGSQPRDFMYIDDVVQAILHIAEEAPNGIYDIGSGQKTTFKEVLEILKTDADFIAKPVNYVEDTVADTSEMKKYYSPKVSFEEGMTEIIEELKL